MNVWMQVGWSYNNKIILLVWQFVVTEGKDGVINNDRYRGQWGQALSFSPNKGYVSIMLYFRNEEESCIIIIIYDYKLYMLDITDVDLCIFFIKYLVNKCCEMTKYVWIPHYPKS